MITKIDKNGFNLIKEFEGCKNKTYRDIVNIPTVGIGFTTYQGKLVDMGLILTDEQIETEFYIQAKTYEKSITDLVTSELNQNQFNSLFSFVYNLGSSTLKKSSMLPLINKNPNDLNIKNTWLKYCNAGGKVVLGLQKRRNKEISIYYS